MKSFYGVAGRVRPGETASLVSELEADGSVIEVVRMSGLELVLADRTREELSDWRALAPGRIAIASGRPLHPVLSTGPRILADLMASDLAGQDPLTEELAGEFVVAIADAPRQRLVLETDCIGLRPMFLHASGGRVVFGSAVWPLARSGLIPREVDLDGLAAWLCFDHPLDDRTLFSAIRRIGPGRVTIDLREGAVEHSIRHDTFGDLTLGRAELADAVDAYVSESSRRIVRDERRLGCFLSGGFDSRYVLSALLDAGSEPDPIILVDAGTGDREAGQMAADALGVHLEVKSIEGSLYDELEEPLYPAEHGFPLTHHYPVLGLNGAPDLPPFVDGLLGDDLIRGWEYEKRIEPRGASAEVVNAGLFGNHLALDPGILFADRRARSIRARALDQVAGFRMNGEPEHKRAWLWVLRNRTRGYHSKNHLQYLQRAETYHPFVTPELIKLRLGHRNELFDRELYKSILSRRGPGLASIPHSDAFRNGRSALYDYSRSFLHRVPRTLNWALREAERVGIRRGFLATRATAYGLGRKSDLYLMREAHRIWTLEDWLVGLGTEIAWSEL